MAKIFISYRRVDSAANAGRIGDYLKVHFGLDAVFRDLENIPPGTKFEAEIAKHLSSCEALVVIIGENWLRVVDQAGKHRLDNPDDYVRTNLSGIGKRCAYAATY